MRRNCRSGLLLTAMAATLLAACTPRPSAPVTTRHRDRPHRAPTHLGPAARRVAEQFTLAAFTYSFNDGTDTWLAAAAPLVTAELAQELHGPLAAEARGPEWQAQRARREVGRARILSTYPMRAASPAARRFDVVVQTEITSAVGTSRRIDALIVDVVDTPDGPRVAAVR